MAKRRKRRNSKKTKRRMVIFAPISAVIIIYFLISFSNYIINIISLNQQKQELQTELATLKENELDLKNEIEKLKDPDYIARFARENYLYSKNGEYIIKLEDTKKKKKSDNSNLAKQYMQYLEIGCGIFGVLVLIWVIRRK